MNAATFEDMKQFVGFDAYCAADLAALRQPLFDSLPRIADLFYETLSRHPQARAVFAGDEDVLARLRGSFRNWLEELFSGCYDQAYLERRLNIGRVHVRINLPPQYMFTAMNVVRLELIREIQRLGISEYGESIAALQKILDLDLAIMNQSYREDLVRRMQEIERAQYEERLSESKHLATVGELAASLAHEIKNPLAGISGAIQIIGAGMDADHPHRDIIDEALRQIDRLDTAVKDLLIFARPKPPEKTRISFNALLERVLLILQEEPAFRRIRIRRETSVSDLWIKADENQVQQLMTNLLINAAHACDPSGEILCRIGRTGRSARILVRDNGVGMAPEVLARVYEPFFTTKAKGTGLGLAICKRIVEAHAGSLDIKSKPGKGTRVTISLPIEEPAIGRGTPAGKQRP